MAGRGAATGPSRLLPAAPLAPMVGIWGTTRAAIRVHLRGLLRARLLGGAVPAHRPHRRALRHLPALRRPAGALLPPRRTAARPLVARPAAGPRRRRRALLAGPRAAGRGRRRRPTGAA